MFLVFSCMIHCKCLSFSEITWSAFKTNSFLHLFLNLSKHLGLLCSIWMGIMWNLTINDFRFVTVALTYFLLIIVGETMHIVLKQFLFINFRWPFSKNLFDKIDTFIPPGWINLQKISIMNKCCSFELSAYQRIIISFPKYEAEQLVSTLIIIRNIYWAVNQYIRLISEDHVTLKTSNDAENQLYISGINYIFTYIQIENIYFKLL